MIAFLIGLYQIIEVLFINEFETRPTVAGTALLILGSYHILRGIGKIPEHW